MVDKETPEIRLKRLHMRSWRRGMKEMDMILGPYADGPLASLNEGELAVYETLLDENDQLLYRWITARISGQQDERGPSALGELLDAIASHAAARLGGEKRNSTE